MNETRTASILQRVPRILAVTAASYGLTGQATGSPSGSAAHVRAASSSSAHASGQRTKRKLGAAH